MTTHVYALFDDEKDYTDAYMEAEREGLLGDSENLKTCRSVEDEDDIPYTGTSMGKEMLGFTLAGAIIGATTGFLAGRLPALDGIPNTMLVILLTLGFGFFGFLAGVFSGASRTESHRQHLWKAFKPGNLAVLLDMRHKETAERIAGIFSRHRARLVEIV